MLDHNNMIRFGIWLLLNTVKVGCYQMVDLNDDGVDDIEEAEESSFEDLDCPAHGCRSVSVRITASTFSASVTGFTMHRRKTFSPAHVVGRHSNAPDRR